MDNLLPRGGGAFLAEVDGNLVGIKESGSNVIEITTHGKFRGPEFTPCSFKLVSGQSDKLVDSKGKKIWSVTAQPIDEDEKERIEQSGGHHQNDLLRTMLDHPGMSIRAMAEKLHWITISGEPNKNHVNRMLFDLEKQKLVKKERKIYVLTPKGKDVAEELPTVHYIEKTPVHSDTKEKASVSFMVTQKQKQQIKGLGYSEEEISGMKPERVHEILARTFDDVTTAWKAQFPNGKGIEVDDLIAAGEKNPTLKTALLKVAPLGRDDTVSNIKLFQWLENNANQERNGFLIKRGMENMWFLENNEPDQK
jgi:DNA-binding PadR family transcriptional regulator